MVGLLHAVGLPVLGIPALLILLLSGSGAPLDTGSHGASTTPPATDRDYAMPSLNPDALPASLRALGGTEGQVPTDSLATAAASPGTTTGLVRLTAADRQIPARVLTAYQQAATTLTTEQPDCHLRWQLVAGIGKIESNHGTGRTIASDGTISPVILGPRLDGTGEFARIVDTDHGRLDHDTTYDRAVGPLQFLPGTWTGSGRDGNHDNTKNPNNIDDAALAAGGYLCAHHRDLANPTDLYAAIHAYNPSDAYVRAVLAWTTGYTTTPPTTSPAISAAPSAPPTPAPAPTVPNTLPTPQATPFPIINLTPRPTTPAVTPATTPPPAPSTTPNCPTITLTTSSLTATLTTTLDITGRYTTTGTATSQTATIHAEAHDTTGHTLTTADTTIPTTPPASPTLITRLPLDHLTAPGQTATITVTLTTTPTGCPTQTLATVTVTGVTRPGTSAPPTPTPSSPAPSASTSPSLEAPA